MEIGAISLNDSISKQFTGTTSYMPLGHFYANSITCSFLLARLPLNFELTSQSKVSTCIGEKCRPIKMVKLPAGF